jgi:hypothetical protein
MATPDPAILLYLRFPYCRLTIWNTGSTGHREQKDIDDADIKETTEAVAVRREIRGGVVDIMQLSFAKRGEDCGFVGLA